MSEKEAVYDGYLVFRAAHRGVYLEQEEGMPYLADWISEQLTSDSDIDYWGGRLRVFLTVKLTDEGWEKTLQAVIPLTISTRISARIATNASADDHFLTLGMLNQDDVA